MNAIISIIGLDARGVSRDSVMLINVILSLAVVVAITTVGCFQNQNSVAVEWFPFLVILSIITGPGGFGFLFGLLMVDEVDSGVRGALSITPIHPLTMLITRTTLIVGYLLVWPILTVFIMDLTWQALHISYGELFLVAAAVALLGPVTSLSIAAYANNKVEALALFKLLSFIVLAPLALKFLPSDIDYEFVFLLSPSTWAYLAFNHFNANNFNHGILYVCGGIAYNGLLLAICIHYFQKSQYKMDA